jgi:DGQHR domain-containing protein
MTVTASPRAAPSTVTAPLATYAVRFRQKRPDVNLYVTTVRFGDLVGRYQSDTYTSANPRGYQRPASPSRIRQVSSYLRQEEGMLPTSILLCVRQPHRVSFEANTEANGKGETGMLTIDADVPLWVVDGQHRLYGLERAIKKDKAKWIADYRLPVVIVEGIDGYEEMRYFHVINTRQKGVPTDVVDRHLLSMRNAEGAALIEREGEKAYLRARATKLTDVLNTHPTSPWQGMIRMPGEPLSPTHTMRQHAMVSSLSPFVNDALVKQVSDEEAATLLLNYWQAARRHWGSAFETPAEYVIQRPLGAGALHMVFPDILEHCRGADDYSIDKMYDVLSYVGRSAGFWHAVRGHQMVRQSGARYIRALAEYLRERLPRPILRRLNT